MNSTSAAAAYNPLDSFERPPSTKAQARAARRAEKANKHIARVAKPLTPKTENQADYLAILRDGDSVIAIGPAGTGKTYLAARVAAQRLIAGDIEKIVVSRVTATKPQHHIGFLPGSADQKMAPWLTPIIEALKCEVSGNTLDQWRKDGKFEIVPFEFMRGRTFDNAFVILDEGQNAVFNDLYLFLTRTGTDTQVVVAGDPSPEQTDIHNSGLEEITDLAEQHEIMDVVEFDENDVVRSPFARKWVQAVAARNRARAFQANDANLDTHPRFLHPAR